MVVWINGTHGSGKTMTSSMTARVQRYWLEISAGLAQYGIPIGHFVLHTDQGTLRERIEGDTVMGPSAFRVCSLQAYAEAAHT